MDRREQSRKEEIVNAITHGLGIIFCLVAMPFVLANALEDGMGVTFFSVLIFGIGMLMVYAFSTSYHYTQRKRLKEVLLIADHISIYFLIAGTYTPLMLKYLPTETAYIFLGILWSIVLIASILKVFYVNKYQLASLVLYVLMGWMLVFVIKPLLNSMPMPIFLWIVAGGVSYCIGVYFYVKSHKMYYHSVWHLFVLLGTVLHSVSIFLSMQNPL